MVTGIRAIQARDLPPLKTGGSKKGQIRFPAKEENLRSGHMSYERVSLSLSNIGGASETDVTVKF